MNLSKMVHICRLKSELSYRRILSMAAPLMLSSLFHHFIGLIDTLFMGKIGEDALAACGVSALYFFVLSMIPYGISIGTQIIIARRDGEGKTTEIGQIVHNTIYFLLFMGAGLFCFLKFGTPRLMGFFFVNEAVLEQGLIYLDYRAWELFPSAIAFSLTAYYTGLGKTRIVLIATMLMLGANLFFNYGLVFGNFGFPRMEIAGAGLASLISTGVATISFLLFGLQEQFRLKHHLFKLSPFNQLHIRKGLNLGGPIVLQHLAGTSAWFLFFILLENMGTAELAISNVIKEIYMVFAITTWGLGNATNTLVSNAIGRGRQNEVLLITRRVCLMAFGFALVFWLIILAIPEKLLGLFTMDEELIELGRLPMMVVGFALVLMSLTTALFRTVTGIGATKFAFYIELVAVPGYMLYVYIVIVKLEGSLALAWASEYIYWTLLGICCLAYLRWGNWRSKEL